ncbi:hypothetical protein [Streptomyces sp. NBC_01275]|uniref:hypothetical protein n=1 Tax=Streptomyces sp. NBC_01275 TaxID=2903807 RepID=UPI002B1E051F|nr:hypothetical protein [Streptomyces sp. NBC_01275]
MWTRRQLIDGIRWRTRTGTPWRDVPEPSVGQPAAGLCGTCARMNPWLRSTFATCSV